MIVTHYSAQMLFDNFAMQAMQSIITREDISLDKIEAIAQRAYKVAAAMMSEREKYQESR